MRGRVLIQISRTDSVIAMTAIQELETAVQQLSEDDFVAFRNWFVEYDAQLWDRQFEDDVQAGRLDWLADEAREALREGHCSER